MEHVIFVSTIPVVYPHVPGAQKVLRVVGNGCIVNVLDRIGGLGMGPRSTRGVGQGRWLVPGGGGGAVGASTA